jgi:solute:Na+ symporter, SSS family
MTALTLLDWSICIGYLATVLGVGLLLARRQETNEQYFVGGRTMHWLPVGLSVFAGTFSSLSFVGLPAEAAYHDYHLLLAVLFIPLVVMPLVGWFFVPLYHRLRVTSPYEYLELRFDTRVRRVASLLFAVYTVLWMGNMLVAVGKVLEVVLRLSPGGVTAILVGVGLFATFYTTIGGVKAVIWTDTLQAAALGGGMLAVFVLAVGLVDGGWSAVWQIGQQHGRFDMFHVELDFTKGYFFGACAYGMFVYLAGHAVHFTAVQRYVSMPSITAARRSLVVTSLMIAVVCTLFFLVGSTVAAYYDQTGDPAFRQFGDEQRGDQLLPHFVMTQLPGLGLVGLLLAGLFAAGMSSIDGGINSLTASVVCDWLRGRPLPVRVSRALTVAFGLLTIGTALVLQRIGGPVFHVLMAFSGAFLGLLLGVFLLGLLCRRANARDPLAGLAVGSAIYLAAKYYGMAFWWDGACTTSATFLAGLCASRLRR